jgi:hypothetical protein
MDFKYGIGHSAGIVRLRTHVTEFSFIGLEWIHPVQDRIQQQAPMNVIINLQIPRRI